MSFQGVLDRLLRHVDGLFLGLLGSCCLRLVSSGSEGSWGAFDSRTVWILKAHRLGFRVSSLFLLWFLSGILKGFWEEKELVCCYAAPTY